MLLEHSLGLCSFAFFLDETIAFPELDVFVEGLSELCGRVMSPLAKDAHFFVELALHDLALHLLLESWDLFYTLGDFALIEEALWCKFFLGLGIGSFIVRLRDLMTGFGATMPFLLLPYPLEKASLARFFSIFVFY